MRSFKNPECGDLVLTRPTGTRKSLNRWAQAIVRAKPVAFSHVAITLDPVHALHAMPRDGVQPVKLVDLLPQDHPPVFKVLRSKAIASDPSLRSELRRSLLYFLSQRYNSAFFLRIGESSSYCSELAAKAYHNVGISLTHRRPRYVLPADIADLTLSPGFVDVTAEYADEYADLPKSELTSEVLAAAQEFDRQISDGYEIGMEFERLQREMALEMEEVRTLVNRASDFMRRRRPELPTPPQYWDSSRRRRGRR